MVAGRVIQRAAVVKNLAVGFILAIYCRSIFVSSVWVDTLALLLSRYDCCETLLSSHFDHRRCNDFL